MYLPLVLSYSIREEADEMAVTDGGTEYYGGWTVEPVTESIPMRMANLRGGDLVPITGSIWA